MNLEMRRAARMAMRGVPERLGLEFARGNIEMRGKPNGTGGTAYTWEGYATVFDAPFNMWDQDGEPFTELVAPGAATRSLANPALDVPFLVGHNSAGIPLARTKSGTMQLSQDSHGLLTYVPGMDGRREEVRALASAVERGDLDEMSLAFVCTGDRWDTGFEQRTITGMELHRGDVCAVTHGANPATAGAMMRAAEQLSYRRPAAIGGPRGLVEARMPTQPYAAAAHDTVTCPQCSSGNDLDARYCDQCGTGMRPATGYLPDSQDTQECRACGSWQAPDARVCDQCGRSMVNDHDSDDGYLASAYYGSRRPVERRSLTAGEKSTFSSDIGDPSKNSTQDLGSAIHRLAQWAGSGSYPQGTSYTDLQWMYDQICAELRKRDPSSTAGGNFPPEKHAASRHAAEQRCPALSNVLASVRSRTAPETSAARRPAELRAAAHEPMTGTHSHPHPAYGSQGGDASHDHEHTHDNDASHGHHGESDASRRPLERRASADESTDLATAPDTDAAAAGHTQPCKTCASNGVSNGRLKHPVTGANGQQCPGCGGTGAVVMVDDTTGIPGDEVQMSAARKLELRLRELDMLELASR